MTPTDYCAAVAAEVRAEMARQGRSRADLAGALGVTPATAARRFSGETPFDVYELALVADWLGVDPAALGPDAMAASA
jgi:transcriptional regulator with XRE-family HTH domain